MRSPSDVHLRSAFAKRSRAFLKCVRKAGIRKRSNALGSVRRRSTTVGLSAISNGLSWSWDDPLRWYSCAAFLFTKTRTQYPIEGHRPF